jgi:branched-chain amino acid transport system permease protein
VLGILHDQVQDVTQHWHLVQGIFVIAVVLFLPRGIAGLISGLGERLSAARHRRSDAASTDE